MRTSLDRRVHRIAAAAAIAGLAALAAAPAQAHAGTAAICTVTFPSVSIAPAFGPFVLAPASGTISSGGETGKVSCIGEIGGDRVTGAGTAGLVYAYSNGTCAAHEGLGTVTWTVPTEAGPKQLIGTLTVRRVGLSILAGARFPQARADFAGALAPIQGDCVLTPLSKVTVAVAGLLTGA